METLTRIRIQPLTAEVGAEVRDADLENLDDEAFEAGDVEPAAVDGTPAWAYGEDGYCVCCGNGKWRHHMPGCVLRDSLDLHPKYRPTEA